MMMNDDLITEILSWLPVKSLMGFKCVCRSWNSLLCNPFFIKFHFYRSSRHHNLLLTSKTIINDRVSDSFVMFCSKCDLLTNQHSTLVATLTATQEGHIHEDHVIGCCKIPLNHKDHEDHVIGCCNGLICLAGSTLSHHDDYMLQFWISFWNPAMKLTSQNSPSLFVEFCSSITPIFGIFGFGNDESSDTYKVVEVFANRSELTMGGDSWREIQDFPGFFIYGKFFECTLNWVAFQTSSELSIVSLDLGKETFKQVHDVLPREFLDKPDQVHAVPTLGVNGLPMRFSG